MSAKPEVPDAWDDDWESQADVCDILGLCHVEAGTSWLLVA